MTTKSYFEKLEKKYGTLTFAGMLKSFRESEDLTQTAFAKKLGLSVQNLNDLEKGRRIPSPSRAAKIAKKLGLPEIGLIQLAIRDSLREEGFNYDIKLLSASQFVEVVFDSADIWLKPDQLLRKKLRKGERVLALQFRNLFYLSVLDKMLELQFVL